MTTMMTTAWEDQKKQRAKEKEAYMNDEMCEVLDPDLWRENQGNQWLQQRQWLSSCCSAIFTAQTSNRMHSLDLEEP